MGNSKVSVNSKALAAALFEKRAGDNKRGPERSLRDVAEEIGVSASTLSRIEREAMPDLLTYVRLCEWMDVPIDKFINR